MHVNTHPGSGGPQAANGGSWHGAAMPTVVLCLGCGCSWGRTSLLLTASLAFGVSAATKPKCHKLDTQSPYTSQPRVLFSAHNAAETAILVRQDANTRVWRRPQTAGFFGSRNTYVQVTLPAQQDQKHPAGSTATRKAAALYASQLCSVDWQVPWRPGQDNFPARPPTKPWVRQVGHESQMR